MRQLWKAFTNWFDSLFAAEPDPIGDWPVIATDPVPAKPKTKRTIKGKTSVVTNDQMASIVLDYHNYLYYKERKLSFMVFNPNTAIVNVDDLVLHWNTQFDYSLSKRSYLRLIEKYENQQG